MLGLLWVLAHGILQYPEIQWKALVNASDMVGIVEVVDDEEYLVNPDLMRSGYVTNADGTKTWRGADPQRGIYGRVNAVRIIEIIRAPKNKIVSMQQTIYIFLPDFILTERSIRSFLKTERYLVFLSLLDPKEYPKTSIVKPGSLDTMRPLDSSSVYTLTGGRSGRLILNGEGSEVVKEVKRIVGSGK
jgi:hypothetical protein